MVEVSVEATEVEATSEGVMPLSAEEDITAVTAAERMVRDITAVTAAPGTMAATAGDTMDTMADTATAEVTMASVPITGSESILTATRDTGFRVIGMKCATHGDAGRSGYPATTHIRDQSLRK